MKKIQKILFALLSIPLYCSAQSLNVILPNPTIYIIEKSALPHTLTVHVERQGKLSATHLFLRGIGMGVPIQVQNVSCDGRFIQEKRPGIWSVPRGCQTLRWQVPLLESSSQAASSQQSIISKDFILLAEASSLPRLQDAGPQEVVKIAIPEIQNIFPATNLAREISLPALNAAPLFILLNSTTVNRASAGPIHLSFIEDNAGANDKLPNMSSFMLGLQWLNTVVPSQNKKDFTIAWLGISPKKVSISGVTGSDLLLTNYPKEGNAPFNKSLLMYIGLHEAFHQFALSYPIQPPWIAESLASYYGARALEIASPNDPNVPSLMRSFLAHARQFPEGLVIINHQLQKGDWSKYGAFYTKGIAFWAAVNAALQQTGDSLDRHVLAIFKAKYNSHGQPKDLQKILNLSPAIWASLRSQFLD